MWLKTEDVRMNRRSMSCCFSSSASSESKVVLLEVTNRCNLGCGYCHALAGKCTDLVLSEERIEALLHEMAENRVRKVILSGGEPLLHKNIRKYVDIIESLGMEADICTNGTIMNDSILAWIKEHFEDVTITLDTFDASIYAEMKRCSISMHEKVINTIKLLIEAGVHVGITIVPTIMNYKELPSVVEKLEHMGVTAISILRLYKMEGATNYEFDEKEFYQDIVKNLETHTDIAIRFKGFGLEPASMGKCPAGEGMLGIGYDGYLYPCLLTRNSAWAVDLSTTSFGDALNMDPIKEFIDKRKCCVNKSCVLSEKCQYGCPAASYIENGTLNCDIRCNYFKS